MTSSWSAFLFPVSTGFLLAGCVRADTVPVTGDLDPNPASGDEAAAGDRNAGDDSSGECAPPLVLASECGVIHEVDPAALGHCYDGYGPCDNGAGGRADFAVSWTAPCAKPVRFGAAAMGSDPDVVLYLMRDTPSPESCLARSAGEPGADYISFLPEAGAEYFIAAEAADANAPFYLSVACNCEASYEICDNGIDDDARLGTDCDDLKCTHLPICAQPFCDFAIPIGCDYQYRAESNADPGASNAISDWCDAGTDIWTGPEQVYAYHDHLDTEVTVRVTSAEDIDLIIVEPCDASSCLARSRTPASGDEEASFQAAAYTQYFFVVEGRHGVMASYDIEVTCVP